MNTPPSADEPSGKTGVILLAYGTPESLDEMPAYLSDVRGGRETPQALIDEITERYRAIGGSPLLEITRSTARRLQRRIGLPVYVGMRHWAPRIEEAVATARADGVERLIAICLAPHYSGLSIGKYREKLMHAVGDAPMAVDFVDAWGVEPGYLAAVAARVRAARERWPEVQRDDVHVVFTAHSLPASIVEQGDPYDAQLRETAARVAEAVGLAAGRWSFCYQSAAKTGTPWLGPQIEAYAVERAEAGDRHLLIAPIGFVADHVEVLYDIDVGVRGICAQHGVRVERTAMLNDAPDLIETLASIVRRRAAASSRPEIAVAASPALNGKAAPPTSRFLRACRGLDVDATPVWFMRQAGRYMAEYRALRERYGILEMIKTPELACEVTLQPMRAFDPDAAIVFADILTILEALGLELTFESGRGPVIHNPIGSAADVAALHATDPVASLAFTMDAIRLATAELGGKPLIGFSGAPFTLASYAIEGGSSRNYVKTKSLMWGEPAVWDRLMDLLADTAADYLIAQVEAGASAVQLFDSWVGALAPRDYRERALPWTRRIVERLRATGVPVIHFGVNTATLLEAITETGADVIGLDWRTPLAEGRARIGDRPVQGNLDPVALFAPWEALQPQVAAVLDAAGGRPGHIFNLGHGILPQTPNDNVRRTIDFVHAYRMRPAEAIGS